MTRTAGAQIGCQRPSRFWGLGCPKIYHEVEDTLVCQGKNDFEAVEGIRKDPFFQQALGIGRVPSSARLRQRFD
ncbi:hypothetical protein, partial [Thiolapillus sp.]|uniref:hypothetical protein n=1 Tax=Thiolapillus sp. TaxID=2017437 RepID=UPI00273A39DE